MVPLSFFLFALLLLFHFFFKAHVDENPMSPNNENSIKLLFNYKYIFFSIFIKFRFLNCYSFACFFFLLCSVAPNLLDLNIKFFVCCCHHLLSKWNKWKWNTKTSRSMHPWHANEKENQTTNKMNYFKAIQMQIVDFHSIIQNSNRTKCFICFRLLFLFFFCFFFFFE